MSDTRWGVWCLEDGAWCSGTVGSRERAKAQLLLWQSGQDGFHYELRPFASTIVYENDLKVFSLDNQEWVVARDPADAQVVYTEQVGKNFFTAHDWLECHPADEISWSDDEDNPYRPTTFAELAKHGRRYLGGEIG